MLAILKTHDFNMSRKRASKLAVMIYCKNLPVKVYQEGVLFIIQN